MEIWSCYNIWAAYKRIVIETTMTLQLYWPVQLVPPCLDIWLYRRIAFHILKRAAEITAGEFQLVVTEEQGNESSGSVINAKYYSSQLP